MVLFQSDAEGGSIALFALIAIAIAIGVRAWIDRSRLVAHWSLAMMVAAAYAALSETAEHAVAGLLWISAGLIGLGGLAKPASGSDKARAYAIGIACLIVFALPILVPPLQLAIAQTGSPAVLAVAISCCMTATPPRSMGWRITVIVATLVSVIVAMLPLRVTGGEQFLLLAGICLLAGAGQQRVTMLQRLALTDELTGLANLRAFRESGARALAQVKRAREAPGVTPLLILADLDGFKLINDREGHEAGNRVLSAFATMLRDELREGDLVARIGGDEFGMLLAGVEAQTSAGLIGRLTRATTALRVPGVASRLTATFATAELLAEDKSIHDVLRRADIDLYARKTARA